MNFLYPIPSNSIVTQTFAEHVHAAHVHGWQNYNGGIDWAVATGTPVKAAQDGKVAMVRQVQSLNANALAAWSDLGATIMHGPSRLSRRQREMIATVVSATNHCSY